MDHRAAGAWFVIPEVPGGGQVQRSMHEWTLRKRPAETAAMH